MRNPRTPFVFSNEAFIAFKRRIRIGRLGYPASSSRGPGASNFHFTGGKMSGGGSVSPSLTPTHFPEKVPATKLWQKIERTNKNRRNFLILIWASLGFFAINLFLLVLNENFIFSDLPPLNRPRYNRKNDLGERIREYRRVHGLSQKQLARLLGIDPITIGARERSENQPSKRLLYKRDLTFCSRI